VAQTAAAATNRCHMLPITDCGAAKTL
jgi:hypothetical protein